MSRALAPASFLYVAARPGGRRKFGIRTARNLGALAESLRGENQLLLRSWKLPGAAREPQLHLKDHASLNEQLAQLLSRGVPLVEALEVTGATVRPAARSKMLRMRDLVAAGSSFADACRSVGGFDAVTIAVYRGAERSGDLVGAARQLAETARRRLRVAGKATTLMLYPAIVLTISIIVASIMLIFVVPMIGEGLAKADIELPTYSKIVMGLGFWLKGHLTLVGLVLAGLAFLALVGRAAVMEAIRRFMRQAPLIRDVVVAQELARFFSVMAAMTRTGVPLADALAVANQAVGHPALRRQLERLRNRLVEGGLLRLLIEEVTQFPIATRRLLVAAERSGDLESAFATLAGDMAEEVDRRSSRFLAVLEPALIVMMFLIIGSLLVSMLLPLLTLTSKVGA
jgi:general secretion pathway protein F